MDVIGSVNSREERPPYIRFETVTMEDVAATKAAGHYVAKDVVYALITPPYSRDINKHKLPQYFDQLAQDVQGGRFRKDWLEMWRDAYQKYLQGQELPVNGIPVKGWGVISPAQQETLIRMGVVTVEDVAAMNDEGIKRIGMGGMDVKNKAKAWLAQLNDKGALAIEMAAIKRENEVKALEVETLKKQVAELMKLVPAASAQPAPPQESESITASDIIEDAPAPVIQRGRKAAQSTL